MESIISDTNHSFLSQDIIQDLGLELENKIDTDKSLYNELIEELESKNLSFKTLNVFDDYENVYVLADVELDDKEWENVLSQTKDSIKREITAHGIFKENNLTEGYLFD